MAYIDLEQARIELATFIKNSDIIPVATRGVTTVTQEFNGTGAQLAFTLTSTPVRNVRGVTVGGVAQSLRDDWTIDYATGILTFVVAPASGTDNVDVQYDYGSTDSIYPDFPRDNLTLGSYPRIGVDIISAASKAAGFGNVHNTDLLISVTIQAKDSLAVSRYGKAVRTAFIAARASFKYLKLITPQAIGPLIDAPNKNGKVLQQAYDFNSNFNYEVQ
jgi:hypothetical protein